MHVGDAPTNVLLARLDYLSRLVVGGSSAQFRISRIILTAHSLELLFNVLDQNLNFLDALFI